MIKTNTPEYTSLQNIIRFYTKVMVDNTSPEMVGKKVITIDISDPRSAATSYRCFKRWGDKMQLTLARTFRKFVEPSGLKGDEIDQFRLTDLNKFVWFFTNPYCIGLITDYLEEHYGDYSLKVKYAKDVVPSFSDIVKANKYIKQSKKSIHWVSPDMLGLEELKASLENPEDINNYLVFRTWNGSAPAMFVECASIIGDDKEWIDRKETNHLRMLYSAYTKADYLGVVPCRYEYWESHPEARFMCNKELIAMNNE